MGYFPSRRVFLGGQMLILGEGRYVHKNDLESFGCLLGIGATTIPTNQESPPSLTKANKDVAGNRNIPIAFTFREWFTY